ncbi:Methyltransferase domain-containing protein [Paenibacillus sp. UNCCL117]|uniref:methyltransferase domain-containing protein n=1 Tax=unclassified Paenibacillus TaxID=185978 RepID=UPI00088D3EB3|nr:MULTISPECIES: methyltransferase domain-containing protein [unclassified Paenibacillus]SDE23889.1 Methyltransferase domain-containing protein [Paenibacillus sp. cl123]SFW42467.1 Methyltransferase domain-containing protein [Paenibacillus sp. UNCCL117]
MKLDIGCGARKQPGFFGLDKQGGPGVDLVCDLNDGIPLPDNSVELVMASRSLPYVDNLQTVLKEIARICVHKAVICILAPYAHHFRHMSNPYIKQKFDEYTPRYLTGRERFFQPPHTAVSPLVIDYDDFDIPYDFRLLRMELLYDSLYRSPLYEPEELSMLKELQVNVVHEIMYHLVVIKKDISEAELLWMSRQRYPEPHGLREYRQQSPEEGVAALAADDKQAKQSPHSGQLVASHLPLQRHQAAAAADAAFAPGSPELAGQASPDATSARNAGKQAQASRRKLRRQTHAGPRQR